MKPKLELPKTLRFPNLDEIPNNEALLEKIELSKKAKIVEGYTLEVNNFNTESPFGFFAEINIDNSRLWDLFVKLCEELPKEVSLIFNLSGDNPNYGRYTDTAEILAFLSDYKKEIVSDTLMEIGMIHHTDLELIEVFIADCKYIKFWGIDQSSFLDIMKSFNLREVKGMQFVDEFPKVREALCTIEDNVKIPPELQQIFDERFQFVSPTAQ